MNFFKFSSLETKIIYILSLIIVLVYIGIKLKKRKYLLSIFNYGIYINFISYYITSIFQYDDIAWEALGENKAEKFYYFLDKNLEINLVGISIYFLFFIFYEFKEKNIYKNNKIENFIIKKTDIKILSVINILVIFSWFLIVFSQLGFNLPIFVNRTFLIYSSLQSIYNILNGYLSILTIILLLFIRKNIITKLLLTVNLFILFGTGNRGPLFSIFLIWFIYRIRKQKINLRNILKYCIIILFLFVGIMYMEKIRSGGNSEIFYKIKYGNSFSDIRDGAFILYGMERLNITYLYGKMYLADLLAFIPSEFLKYRESYAYSNFTTKYLFNWQQHYGLRGGMFLGPYINFGYIGVLIIGYISARIMAKIENYYYYEKITYKNYYYVILLVLLSNSILITVVFMDLYIILGQIFVLVVMVNLLKNKERNRSDEK